MIFGWKMKRSNILTLIFLSFLTLTANGGTYYTSNKPYELKILIESLTQELLSNKERTNLESLINSYNKLADIDQVDFLIIVKTEIYKEFATLHQNKVSDPGLKLDDIQKRLAKIKLKSYSKFSKWFIRSLQQDVESAILEKTRIKRSTNQTERRVFIGKLSHINRLYQLLANNSADNFDSLVSKATRIVLQRSYNYMLYLDRFSHNKKIDPLKMPLFTAVETKDDNGENLDDILAPVLNGNNEDQKKSGDWSPADDMVNLKDENYTPPEELPSPTDDWDFDNKHIIEMIDDDYTPPKELPTPVDDWDIVPEVVPTEKKKRVDPEDDWVLQ